MSLLKIPEEMRVVEEQVAMQVVVIHFHGAARLVAEVVSVDSSGDAEIHFHGEHVVLVEAMQLMLPEVEVLVEDAPHRAKVIVISVRAQTIGLVHAHSEDAVAEEDHEDEVEEELLFT